MEWFEIQGEVALQWLETRCNDSGVPVSTELLAGGVPELILRKASNAQLLAIGRCGHGHKDDPNALGHKFRNIAHHAHMPLLVGGKAERSLRRLLLAYHGRAHADRALTWTIRLQQALSAEVIALVVDEESNSHPVRSEMEEIEIRLAQSKLNQYRLLSTQGQPADKIAELAASIDADLILVGSYRHRAFVEWLMGSTVDRLLRATSLPVLIA